MRITGFMALAVWLLCGCSEVSHKVVGVWDLKGGPYPATITFQPDGVYLTASTSANGPTNGSGEYRREGDTIYMNGQGGLSLTMHLDSDNRGTIVGNDGKALKLERLK